MPFLLGNNNGNNNTVDVYSYLCCVAINIILPIVWLFILTLFSSNNSKGLYRWYSTSLTNDTFITAHQLVPALLAQNYLRSHIFEVIVSKFSLIQIWKRLVEKLLGFYPATNYEMVSKSWWCQENPSLYRDVSESHNDALLKISIIFTAQSQQLLCMSYIFCL